MPAFGLELTLVAGAPTIISGKLSPFTSFPAEIEAPKSELTGPTRLKPLVPSRLAVWISIAAAA